MTYTANANRGRGNAAIFRNMPLTATLSPLAALAGEGGTPAPKGLGG
jgi:hypothetical protein